VPTPTAIPRLRTPLVLVHGLCGFKRLQIGGRTISPLDYFPGITEALEAAGQSRPCSVSVTDRRHRGARPPS